MRLGRLGVCVATLVISLMAGVAASTPGGTTIANAVTVSYTDGTRTFTSQSNTVQSTVATVSALTVSPKNAAANPATDGYPLGSPVTRAFTITNTSNIPDAYTLTAVTAGSGATVTSATFVTANGPTNALAGGLSPVVQPGGTITVSVTIATTGIAIGTPIAISITARTTVTGTQTGLASDSGRQWAVSAGVPQMGGLSGANSTISKTVDGLPSESNTPGSTVTYAIAFRNWGAVAATNAKLIDAVPAGIVADPASAKLNGVPIAATLAGQTLTVALGTVAPNVAMTLTFKAVVGPAETIGSSYVNVASFTADGVAAIGTTPASVLVGTTNIVYDGARGASAPIAGAVVALVDPQTGLPLSIANLASSARATASIVNSVNPQNVNPFRTGASGVYGFTIPAPPAGATANYQLIITASGYLNRKIAVKLTPDASGVLYTVASTSLDGQPLAAAGGYALTTTSVQLSNVFSLLGNLPLFRAQSITVSKTADKTQAAPGDRVGYTVTFTSNGQNALTSATIADSLPAGLAYAPGTARVDGAAVEPVVQGGQLVWTLAAIAPGANHTITYDCVILPAVSSGTTLTNTVAIAGTIAGTQLTATGTGSVSVVAVSGAFTTQAVITGRVFVDDLKTGHFRSGDRVLEGVRLYLESGESVVTDKTGRFSFPGVRGGLHVLRLDETTLPGSARAYDDRRYDSVRSPIRLIHGTMDLGMLQDVNFALEPH